MPLVAYIGVFAMTLIPKLIWKYLKRTFAIFCLDRPLCTMRKLSLRYFMVEKKLREKRPKGLKLSDMTEDAQ